MKTTLFGVCVFGVAGGEALPFFCLFGSMKPTLLLHVFFR